MYLAMAPTDQRLEALPFLEKHGNSFESDTQTWPDEGQPATLRRRLLQRLLDSRMLTLAISNVVFLLLLICRPVREVDPTVALYCESSVNELTSTTRIAMDDTKCEFSSCASYC